MAAGAGVPLECNVTALVDCKAIVLVHYSTTIKTSCHDSGMIAEFCLPVLDDQVRRAAVEAISVVACSFAATLGIRLIAER